MLVVIAEPLRTAATSGQLDEVEIAVPAGRWPVRRSIRGTQETAERSFLASLDPDGKSRSMPVTSALQCLGVDRLLKHDDLALAGVGIPVVLVGSTG
jgi:hypothetical protein